MEKWNIIAVILMTLSDQRAAWNDFAVVSVTV